MLHGYFLDLFLSSSFALFEGWFAEKVKTASVPEMGTTGMRLSNPKGPHGKEAEHGVYLIVPDAAIRIPLRFYATKLSDFPVPDERLGLVASA
jgi:hypothetical protein